MEYAALLLAFLAGLVLGGIYFGGLWLTVRLVAGAKRSAFWFLLSFVVRAAVLLGGVFLIAAGHWQRIVACLVGAMLARIAATRLASSNSQTAT